MKQIPFFSALCCSLVMASCGGGATEKTSALIPQHYYKIFFLST